MKGKIRNSVLRISILFLAIAAMVLGTALPVMADAGVASALSFSTQPAGASGGAALSVQPVVSVLDSTNAVVTTFNGQVTLAIGTNAGSGALSGTATVNAINGVATFTGLSINKAGTGYTLTASSTGLAGAISNPFNITVGSATKVAFTTAPGGAAPGAALNPQPVVTVQDAGGNTITSYIGTVSLAIGNNPPGGVLSGATAVTVASGVAAFSGLNINLAGQGYTLVATSNPALTSATSGAFNITAVTPSPTPTPTPTPGRPGAVRTVQGTVVSVGTNQFVIKLGNQTQATISVDGNTNYFLVNTGKVQNYVNNQAKKVEKRLPGVQKRIQELKQAHIPANWRNDFGWLATFDKKAQFSDIQVGDKVIARVTTDSSPLAKQVLIVKPPVIQQVKGVVTAVSDNPKTITITPNNGTAVTLNWDTSTRFILKGVISMNGHMATAVYNRITMKTQLVNVLPAAPASNPVAALNITTVSLPNGTVNLGYSQQVAATGGTTPYTWAVISGSLPAGLTLNASTGFISGTPTTVGTSSFTMQVTGGTTTSKAFTIQIGAGA